jgi:hypothetical protein
MRSRHTTSASRRARLSCWGFEQAERQHLRLRREYTVGQIRFFCIRQIQTVQPALFAPRAISVFSQRDC